MNETVRALRELSSEVLDAAAEIERLEARVQDATELIHDLATALTTDHPGPHCAVCDRIRTNTAWPVRAAAVLNEEV